ncbi:MAG: Gfo/Idh/MocA family oxidoreductase [Spirochaetales bacterium]|nr:Gfo/Idh/MocA family oxidoreductase [Spirochaetales bacterium]
MINVAVVGCGYWGPNLIRNFYALSDCRVGKICDSNRERLEHVGRLYPGSELTEDFASVVEDPGVDAVAIVTPVHTHFALARQTLQAGKHTFIEKPMASSVAECRELLAVARERSLTLMVGHTFVYHPTVRKIKDVVDSGELGEIMYISSRRLNLGLFQYDINVAWDLAPHDISIILYLLGKNPISVNCQGKAHVKPGIEDVTNITLNYANGAFAMIHSSWIDPKKVREITIVGSKKMLVYDDNEPLEKIKIYDKCVEAPPHYDTYAEFHYSYHYGDMHAPYVKQVEPLKVECQAFLDAISDGGPGPSSGDKGLEVVQILEAASRSLDRDGAPVLIDDLVAVKAR